MKIKILAVGMLLGLVSQSHAIKRTVILDNSNNKDVASQEARSAFGNGNDVLSVDDGIAETTIGDAGQFIWFNRFTPDPADFPFQLEEVHVVFGNTLVNVGDSVEIFIYEDPDGDGDPATGAVLLSNETKTVLANDGLAFSEYQLTNPVVLRNGGDILIGVVNRAGFEGNEDFPAGIDTTTTAERSWVGSYTNGDVPAVPTFPADEQWGTIDSFGLPGNWMVRGIGSVNTPVQLMNFSID